MCVIKVLYFHTFTVFDLYACNVVTSVLST
jgi:hypothetical protein